MPTFLLGVVCVRAMPDGTAAPRLSARSTATYAFAAPSTNAATASGLDTKIE